MEGIGTSSAEEAMNTPRGDVLMTRKGEAQKCGFQARKGAHDKGHVTEEPYEGKLSCTVLKQRREGRPSRDREAALTLYLELTQTAGVHRRPNGERVKHFVSRARALVLVAEAHGYASALGCREDLMRERKRVQIRIKRLRGEGEEVPADLERLAEAKFPKRSEM